MPPPILLQPHAENTTAVIIFSLTMMGLIAITYPLIVLMEKGGNWFSNLRARKISNGKGKRGEGEPYDDESFPAITSTQILDDEKYEKSAVKERGTQVRPSDLYNANVEIERQAKPIPPLKAKPLPKHISSTDFEADWVLATMNRGGAGAADWTKGTKITGEARGTDWTTNNPGGAGAANWTNPGAISATDWTTKNPDAAGASDFELTLLDSESSSEHCDKSVVTEYSYKRPVYDAFVMAKMSSTTFATTDLTTQTSKLDCQPIDSKSTADYWVSNDIIIIPDESAIKKSHKSVQHMPLSIASKSVSTLANQDASEETAVQSSIENKTGQSPVLEATTQHEHREAYLSSELRIAPQTQDEGEVIQTTTEYKYIPAKTKGRSPPVPNFSSNRILRPVRKSPSRSPSCSCEPSSCHPCPSRTVDVCQMQHCSRKPPKQVKVCGSCRSKTKRDDANCDDDKSKFW